MDTASAVSGDGKLFYFLSWTVLFISGATAYQLVCSWSAILSGLLFNDIVFVLAMMSVTSHSVGAKAGLQLGFGLDMTGTCSERWECRCTKATRITLTGRSKHSRALVVLEGR